jgi:hypothetical protein
MTLSWTRPDGGIGPDEVQRSALGNLTFVDDDAESGTDGWSITTNGVGVLGWQTTDLKSNSGQMSFVARGLDLPSAAESILEWDAPIKVPAKGATILQWFDWYTGESDDAAIVEIHDGKKWVVISSQTNPPFAHDALLSYLADPMTLHKFDLSKDFAGKTVKLRFRYAAGPETKAASIALIGWHVDDISIKSAHWETLARSGLAKLHLTNLADGKHFFRVRSAYRTGFGVVVPGPWSEQVSASVKGKLPVVRGTKKPRGALPATGVGTPAMAFVLLGGAAVTLRAMRRART